MSKPKILVQLDPDPHASVFDAVVSIDAGIDKLLQYHQVEPAQVRDLVHGCMFTRGPQDLKSTAIFIGGSNVAAGEVLLKRVQDCFFGPMRVSVMLDANGANTTAAAAVLAAEKHVKLADSTATVLAGTGPVGQRIARLLAREGTHVKIASRSLDRSLATCQSIQIAVPQAKVEPVQTASTKEILSAVTNVELIFSAGAAGIELLPDACWSECKRAKVAIDLNAVPPTGISGIQVMDKGIDRHGILCYGAIGVGGTKMKIHKAAIAKLFEANDLLLDAEQIFALGRTL
jgi:methylenetetrahydrofolate/methylenetetrahydromethanopterin dehydrogenase (NADP+)